MSDRSLFTTALVAAPDSVPEARMLRGWLEAWGGIDGVLSGMNRQDYAPLPQSPFGWRAEFCQTQVNTSPTLIGQGSAPEPWRAVRLAALDTLKRDQQQ
jgi:hypothetical protein